MRNLLFALVAMSAAGCAMMLPDDYVEVRNSPEMAKYWQQYLESSESGHGVTMFVPSWCNLVDMHKKDRGYCFPIYYVEHNSLAEKPFFFRQLEKLSTQMDFDCREWAKAGMEKNGYKVLSVESIPLKKEMVSETAGIFLSGASLVLADAADVRKEVKVFKAFYIVFANDMFSYGHMSVTTHDALEEQAAWEDLVKFVKFLQSYNWLMGRCHPGYNR